MTRLIRVAIAAMLIFSFPSITHADSPAVIQPQSISTNYHTCAVQESGTLRCWGGNGWGESNVPSDLGLVQSVDVGGDSTCAIQVSGDLRCWGRNDTGQTEFPSGLGKVRQVSLGVYHTCAVVSNGDVRCWGSNTSGEANVPSYFKASKVAAGYRYTCGVGVLGDLSCWGNSDNGIHGNLDIPADLGKVRDISLGWVTACAIRLNGELVCWGDSSRSQVPAGLGKVKSVSVGWAHVCAISESDDLYCWGLNTNNQVVIPAGLGKVLEVSAGDRGTCVIDHSYTARCWGNSGFIQQNPPEDLGKLQLDFFSNPNIIGTAYVNSQITSEQTSALSGVNYSYQWLRDGETILGATQSNYLVSKKDYLHYLSVQVTGATEGSLIQTKTSSEVFVIRDKESLGELSLIGSARVANKITAKLTNYLSKFDYTYQWFRNQSPIIGETDKTYKLKPEDAGKVISVQSCRLYKGKTIDCARTAISQSVDPGSLGSLKLSVAGIHKVNRLVTASVAARISDLGLSYQWLRDGQEIVGATAKTYLVQQSDLGSQISCRVIVSKPGYETQVKESAPKRIG